MRVDGYKIESKEIADVIDKLAEADGSPVKHSRLAYLEEASALILAAYAAAARRRG